MAKPINVVIKGDYTDRDIQRAIRDLERLKTQGNDTRTGMGALAGSLKSVLGPAMIGAAAAAGTMAIALGVDAVRAAIEEEAAASKLARTLKNLGFEGATASVEAFIDATQRSTGVADDVLRPALDRLVRSTNNVNEAQGLLKLALDVSAGTGKTLQQTVEALSRASDGNTTSLKRLGTGLDETTLKTKDMDLITAKLAQRFEGQAATAAETMQGRLAKLSVAFDELKESFGTGFLQGLQEASGGIDDIGSGLQSMERILTFLGNTVGQFFVTISAAFIQLAEAGRALRRGDFIEALSILAADTKTFVAGWNDFDEATKNFGGGNLAVGMERTNEHMAYADVLAQKAAKSVDKLDDSTRSAAGGTDKLTESQRRAQQRVQEYIRQVQDLEKALQGLNDIVSAPADVMDAIANLGKATFEKINFVIDAFKSRFEEAKSFAQGIVSTFMDGLDLGAALASAKEAGTSIVEEFVKQGNRAKEFGARMKELLAAGLSKSAMQDIMDLGFDRGLDVMKALQDGNVRQNIDGINEVYSSVEEMANSVADQAKAVFYDAGLNLMLEMLRAMIEELMPAGKTRKRLMALMDSLAASMNRTATITVQTVFSGGTPSASEISAAMPGYTGPTFTAPVDFTQFGAGLQLFADGGIATSPTFGVFGEAGPEALIPLDRMGSMGGNTYNINVSTGVGDPRQIGEQVVSYIKRFEAASGPVFARA